MIRERYRNGAIYSSTGAAEDFAGGGAAGVLVAGVLVADLTVDTPDMPVLNRQGLIAKRVLLSAQLVLPPLIVNGAVVVMQSHSKVGLPCTDIDGRNGKQFSVFV